MSKAPQKQYIAIVKCDVVGYTKSPSGLKRYIYELISSIPKKYLTSVNHILCKSEGDSLLIVFNDCEIAAKIALEIRDEFKKYDWQSKGFTEPKEIRVALHFGCDEIQYSEGVAVDIYGDTVDTVARLEASAKPGHVICSDFFKTTLKQTGSNFYKFIDLGTLELPKNYGQMHCHHILWHWEIQENMANSANKSNIESSWQDYLPRQKLTDIDKIDFLEKAFDEIATLFFVRSDTIMKSKQSIQTRYKRIDANRFLMSVFLDGATEIECLAWIGGKFGTKNQINYSIGRNIDPNNTSSMNGWLELIEDKGTLHFTAPFHSMSFHTSDITSLSATKAGEYLWDELFKSIRGGDQWYT